MKAKINIITIIITFISLLSTNCFCQDMTEQSTPYLKHLGKAIEKMKTSKTESEAKEAINTFKRLKALYPEEWLTDYYTAYFEIQWSFVLPSDSKQELLTDSEKHISQLKLMSNSDLSEVLTLEGLMYYAVVAMNPSKNGQLYYKNIISSYQKAIQKNENNPRAHTMLFIFQSQMAKHTGMSMTEDQVKEKVAFIQSLYQKESNASRALYMPSWGQERLKTMR